MYSKDKRTSLISFFSRTFQSLNMFILQPEMERALTSQKDSLCTHYDFLSIFFSTFTLWDLKKKRIFQSNLVMEAGIFKINELNFILF